MIAALLTAAAIGYLVGRYRRRRRDHEPRAARLQLAAPRDPRFPMSRREAWEAGEATFGGDCAWCTRRLDLCDADPRPCRGWERRRWIAGRPVAMPIPGPGTRSRR